ncbi:hypothetical protein MMC32_004451 [Xylographa parallela]|nr:hypothetical protein [Xylographa parallela]
MTTSVFQLQCSCNEYPWGKKGNDSLAARLCSKTPGTSFTIDDGKEYSEMWMGDYPILPAKSLETGQELHSIIDENKEKLLGKRCIEKFGGVLPYLPKILSIQKALPLQIHPNKALAAKLHEKQPDQFTDPNHKPEIAVALSKFEVFAGWKPLEEMQTLFSLEPLHRFRPEGNAHFDDGTLKQVTRTILKASEEVVRDTQEKLASLPREKYGKQSYILDILPRLQEQYSKEDNGNLIALLCMNFMVLSVGEAIYIPADGIHAYLSGDIVECMARSNNVLNTGFCPRADRDSIDLFSSSLSFGPHSVEDIMLSSKSTDKGKHGKTVIYAPPMSEFDMLLTELESGDTEEIEASDGPTVMWVTSGSGLMKVNGKEFKLDEGYVFFIGSGVQVTYEAESTLAIYAAIV